jgi:YHS domain-containing protein
VIAFIFADLIVLPIVAAYIKYYGRPFALRITALMFVVIVIAALIVDGLFSVLGLIPDTRPSTNDVFGSIEVDYKLVLNVLATVIFAGLMLLTVRRGAKDPVCGMSVDKSKAKKLEYKGTTYYFCSDDCKATFEADPERYAGKGRAHDEAHASHAHTH